MSQDPPASGLGREVRFSQNDNITTTTRQTHISLPENNALQIQDTVTFHAGI